MRDLYAGEHCVALSRPTYSVMLSCIIYPGIVLSPTRELASQTLKFVNIMGKFTDLRSIVILGGESIELQFEEVRLIVAISLSFV